MVHETVNVGTETAAALKAQVCLFYKMDMFKMQERDLILFSCGPCFILCLICAACPDWTNEPDSQWARLDPFFDQEGYAVGQGTR